MFSTIWSTVTGAFSGLYGYLAIGALCLLAGATGTWRVMSWHAEAQQAVQINRTVQLVAGESNITLAVEVDYAHTAAALAASTQQRINEVPVHVTPEIDRKYPVPLGFVRVWNDAAHGPVPASSAGPDDADSGVPLSDVAQAGVADEGTLDICRAKVTAWQDWYTQQSAAWEKHK